MGLTRRNFMKYSQDCKMYKTSNNRTKKLYAGRARIYNISHHLQTLWADDIHRKAVVDYSDFNEGDVVLDVGTGTSLTAIKSIEDNPSVYVVGLDITIEMLCQGKKNIVENGLENRIKGVNGNLEELPFPDNSFDKVISAYGFGGVENPEKAFAELVRVSKPNARITMLEMAAPKNKFWKLFHKALIEPMIKCLWEFRDLDLRKLYENAGMEIEKERYFKNRIFGSSFLVSGIVRK